MLYLVLDRQIAGKNILNIAKCAAKSAIDIVQFRDKISSDRDFLTMSYRLKKIFNNRKTFIINDRADIAMLIDADGLHLGQEDIGVEYARRILGNEKIIGLSCHNIIQITNANKENIDYLSIGPIFETPLKPDYKVTGINLIKKIRNKITIPLFVIGGININNISCLIKLGIKKIAACRLFCDAKNIIETAATIKNRLTN